MAKKIFIAATDQHSGKTTISLCLMHLARQHFGDVGFMKPVGQEYVRLNGLDVDKDTALMAKTYGLMDDLPYMSPVVTTQGFTKSVLDGEVTPAQLHERILSCCAELERRHKVLIIEGTGHGGVGSIMGVSNARVARLCQAPVLIVCKGGIGSAADAVRLNLPLYEREGARVPWVLVNKILPDKRESSLHYLRKAFADEPLSVLGGLDFFPALAYPSVHQVAKFLGTELRGDQNADSRLIQHIHLGAASAQRCADLLKEATLLVATSTRDELIVTMAGLYKLPEYRTKLAGLVVSGASTVSHVSQQILDNSGVPYLRMPRTTGEVFVGIRNFISKTGPEDTEKIRCIQTFGERDIDCEELLSTL